MKFPPFAYRSPRSIEEAVEILASDPEAKVLAGGQSLLPCLPFGSRNPASSWTSAASTGSLVQADDGLLRIGAATLSELEDSRLVSDQAPVLAKAVRKVAHRPIRNRARSAAASRTPIRPLSCPPSRSPSRRRYRAGPLGRAADRCLGLLHRRVHDRAARRRDPDSIEFPIRNGNWSFSRSPDARATSRSRSRQSASSSTEKRARGEGRPAGSRLQAGAPAAAEEMLEQHGDRRRGRCAGGGRSGRRPSAAGDIHASADYRKGVAGTLVRRATLEAGRRTQ